MFDKGVGWRPLDFSSARAASQAPTTVRVSAPGMIIEGVSEPGRFLAWRGPASCRFHTMFSMHGPFTRFGIRRLSSRCLRRLDEGHVGACLDRGIGAPDRFLEAQHCA